jgi:hypothetical protein
VNFNLSFGTQCLCACCRCIVGYAAACGGIIVSNKQFEELGNENSSQKRVIQQRLVNTVVVSHCVFLVLLTFKRLLLAYVNFGSVSELCPCEGSWSNLFSRHSDGKNFSIRELQICSIYFRELGHRVIIFIPHSILSTLELPEQVLLMHLKEMGQVEFTYSDDHFYDRWVLRLVAVCIVCVCVCVTGQESSSSIATR